VLIEIAKYLFIAAIAIPFLYMVFDVIFDAAKRFYGWYNRKPAFIRILSRSGRKR